ncbi:MAG: hypothetical protein QW594_04420, partial [Candidatus Woesearchaeota archaeon]
MEIHQQRIQNNNGNNNEKRTTLKHQGNNKTHSWENSSENQHIQHTNQTQSIEEKLNQLASVVQRHHYEKEIIIKGCILCQ